jgi:serine/arginine repetitive matrix protein 2
MEREVSGSGSIALRAMKSMRSMARLTSWSQPKADEKEMKKEKADQKREKEEGVEKKKSKKSKKEKEVAEKKAAKEKKARDGTVKMSTSSFEAGSMSDAGIPKVSLEVPPEDNVPKTIGKKQSVLGLGLPSSLRFGTARSAVSTATSSTTDAKEERPSTGTVRRTSISSTASLNLLTSRRRPSSTVSNSSSLRPPSSASGMSRLSSSSASVKWDEEGLETVKEMRKKDREERRRNSTDSNAVLNDATKKGSRRSAEGRKRPLVSDLFAELDINSRPTSPEVQSQRSSLISKEGPVVNIETATNDGHGHASDRETLETPVKRARPRPVSEQMLSNMPRPQGIYENVERKDNYSIA